MNHILVFLVRTFLTKFSFLGSVEFTKLMNQHFNALIFSQFFNTDQTIVCISTIIMQKFHGFSGPQPPVAHVVLHFYHSCGLLFVPNSKVFQFSLVNANFYHLPFCLRSLLVFIFSLSFSAYFFNLTFCFFQIFSYKKNKIALKS